MPVEPARALEGAGGNTQSKGETAAAHGSGEPLLTKLELITRRAKQEPRCRFTSLADLLDEGFLTNIKHRRHLYEKSYLPLRFYVNLFVYRLQ